MLASVLHASYALSSLSHLLLESLRHQFCSCKGAIAALLLPEIADFRSAAYLARLIPATSLDSHARTEVLRSVAAASVAAWRLAVWRHAANRAGHRRAATMAGRRARRPHNNYNSAKQRLQWPGRDHTESQNLPPKELAKRALKKDLVENQRGLGARRWRRRRRRRRRRETRLLQVPATANFDRSLYDEACTFQDEI